MRTFPVLNVAVVASMFIVACTSTAPDAPPPSTQAAAATPDPWLRPAAVPFTPGNEPSQARVDLGRALFFDTRLSGSEMLSCAWCHNPSRGWSDGQPTAIGTGFKHLGRKTPTVLNTAYNPLQMWDGRKTTLEDQALGPIGSPDEMNLPLDKMVARLQTIAGYKPLFDAAYPGEGITQQTVAKAIASFERTVVSTNAPFDRWREGDDRAISDSAKRGFALFTGKANCSLCHQGFNFTDNGYHNIGVRSLTGTEDDGRFAQRKVKVNKGAFKTPTLRDAELTAPYMHNGIYKTLEEVVDHYDRGGDVKGNLDANMKPLGLTPAEKADLVAFMKTLTGPPLHIEVPVLPVY
jgi:cytochrome c peroxidase